MRCTSARDSGDEIQRSFCEMRAPLRAPLFAWGRTSWPSSVSADLSVTRGLRETIQRAKASFRRRASASRRPVLTSIPAARNCLKPRPATAGFGSAIAATTRATPAAINACVHGPGAAGVAARLQVDVERCASRGFACGFKSDDFRVAHAVIRVESFAHDASVAHKNRADQRVGACERDATSRQLERAVHKDGVSGGSGCGTRRCGRIHIDLSSAPNVCGRFRVAHDFSSVEFWYMLPGRLKPSTSSKRCATD